MPKSSEFLGGVDMGTRLADLALPEVNRIADLLVILEERYGCQFRSREIDQIITVGDLAALLERKAGAPERPGFWYPSDSEERRPVRYAVGLNAAVY